jgi:dynein light chain 1, axonemal
MPGTPCAKAIQLWAEKNPTQPAEEASVIKLMCLNPPIDKMDATLNTLVGVRHLSLSTNCIDKMISLSNLKNLEVLSLGRNMIKKIQGLDEIGATLKELWISYNLITSLDGLQQCSKLTTLYISNNKIKDWAEVRKLQTVSNLGNVTFVGNPVYDGFTKKTVRPTFVKNFPQCKVLDGEMVTEADTGVDEVLEEARNKLTQAHGSVDAALVVAPEFADPTRTETIPQDAAVKALIGLGLPSALAENVYGRIDPDKKGGVVIQTVRRALGVQ